MRTHSVTAWGREGCQLVKSASYEQSRKPVHALEHAMPSAAAVLAWLEAHATEIAIQAIPPDRRQKNRAIVQYRDAAGGIQAVGGANIRAALWRAGMRLRAAERQL